MKKRFMILATASIFFASSVGAQAGFSQTAHAETAYSVTLSIGSGGTDVFVLQANLKKLGYFTYPTITGYYGTVTSAAVGQFQQANGLTATGAADPVTRAVIEQAVIKKTGTSSAFVSADPVYTASLYQGTSSAAVGALQTNLQTLGFFTYPNITGYYGSITAAAVADFQNKYGLPATGVADPGTLTAIDHALLKKKLVADTYSYIGVRYAWGGSSTGTGFDCSGFVYYMFNKFGVNNVRTTSDNLFMQGITVQRASLQPGDLVFFGINTPGVVSHVGFYVGNNKFISATSSAGIFIQSLDSTYWGPKYLGAKRVY